MSEKDLKNPSTPEDLFDVYTLFPQKKLKVLAELRDSEDKPLVLSDVTLHLLKYMLEKTLEKKGNDYIERIVPLLSQAMIFTLCDMYGYQATKDFIANESFREPASKLMSVAFLLLKYIQDEELNIAILEEDLTEEQMNGYMDNSIAPLSSSTEDFRDMPPLIDYKQAIKELVNLGQIKKEEIKEVLQALEEDSIED